jgi:hypothetical protein
VPIDACRRSWSGPPRAPLRVKLSHRRERRKRPISTPRNSERSFHPAASSARRHGDRGTRAVLAVSPTGRRSLPPGAGDAVIAMGERRLPAAAMVCCGGVSRGCTAQGGALQWLLFFLSSHGRPLVCGVSLEHAPCCETPARTRGHRGSCHHSSLGHQVQPATRGGVLPPQAARLGRLAPGRAVPQRAGRVKMSVPCRGQRRHGERLLPYRTA